MIRVRKLPLWIASVLALQLWTSTGFGAVRTYEDADSVVFLGVADGDTFYATIPGWTHIIGDSIKVRLLGVNCLETRASQDSTHLAQQAKAFTQRVLSRATLISLKETQRGSFFRVIAEVQVDGEDIGRMLVENGLCVECDQSCNRISVYATPKGGRYHLINCSQIARSQTKERFTIKDARKKNLKSCYYCDPDRFDGND